MSGKILIVDDLATNRIILKARLTAAHYDVLQARSGEEAIDLVLSEHPDLLLVNASLPDMTSTTFLDSLRRQEGARKTPVVLLLPENTSDLRLKALRAGASDVIEKPLEGPLLMAKLRSLLRQQNADHDLQLHADTPEPMGFAEDQGGFQRRGKVALVSPDIARAMRLRTALSGQHQLEVTAFQTNSVNCFDSDAIQPDIFMLCIGPNDGEASLRFLVELLTNPHTRHSRIMARLSSEAMPLAETLLNMGAHDVIPDTMGQAEMALRLRMQIAQKHQSDELRARLQRRLKSAVIDPLTGLYNRRYALPCLERMITHASPEDPPFAVIAADLDHFKRINDTYGHPAGDSVLSGIAALLRDNLRDEDMIARIGGEEFLIVIPDTSPSEARQTAGRLRRLIQRTPVQVGPTQEPVHVTISMGVTLFDPASGAERPTVEMLLEQADRALYGAKADGRNTVTLGGRDAA